MSEKNEAQGTQVPWADPEGETPIHRLTEDIRKGLKGAALEDFDKLLALMEDLEQVISNPPAMLGVDGDALRGFIHWMQTMSVIVHMSSRNMEPEEYDKAVIDSSPLGIVSGIVVGFLLANQHGSGGLTPEA